MSGVGRKLLDLWEASLHQLMRLAPTEASSAIGSRIVRLNVKYNRPEIIAGARRNLARHRPDLDPQAADRLIDRFLDNVGRLMAEYSRLHRLIPEKRVEMIGLQAFNECRGRAPLLVLVLHTGNWEVFGPALQSIGATTAAFYEPPASAVQRRIAEDTRRRFGLQLLTPDARGLREALRVLNQKHAVAIFGDEARGGQTMAPLFGRPPHTKGNLAVAARLARQTDAKIVVTHCERLADCRFGLFTSEPFKLPAKAADWTLAGDVAFLNARIEPIVLRNLDRWYFLDDSIAPLSDDEPAEPPAVVGAPAPDCARPAP